MSPKIKPNLYKCRNPKCQTLVSRLPWEIESSGNIFCSHSCSATITNSLRPSSKQKRSKCQNPDCENEVTEIGNKCCSRKCRYVLSRLKNGYTRNGILSSINRFYIKHSRIPLKREFNKYYRPARLIFGTWNNAIKAAGLEPNPVKFANHHYAKDGHRCDSLSEKILDDWLYKNGIPHQIHVRYPWLGNMIADFKIGDYWIELFGLSGQHKRYDFLKSKKLKLIKEYNLKFISLSIDDVLSIKLLSKKLEVLISNYSKQPMLISVAR